MRRVKIIFTVVLAGITMLAGARTLFPDYKVSPITMDQKTKQINEVEDPPTEKGN